MWEWAAENFIFPTAAAIITAAITWAAAAFTKWSGIQIEAKHREALHSALMTGVRMALERLGAGFGQTAKTNVALEAIGYVKTSVPDAIRHLGPDDAHLLAMADAKIQEALSARKEGP